MIMLKSLAVNILHKLQMRSLSHPCKKKPVLITARCDFCPLPVIIIFLVWQAPCTTLCANNALSHPHITALRLQPVALISS